MGHYDGPIPPVGMPTEEELDTFIGLQREKAQKASDELGEREVRALERIADALEKLVQIRVELGHL